MPVPEFLFLKKVTVAQVFSCEFYEISKNNFSYRTPPLVASVSSVRTYTNRIQV